MVQVPTVTMVRSDPSGPDVVQTDGVVDANDTCKPELAVALSVTVAGSNSIVGKAAKVIVCGCCCSKLRTMFPVKLLKPSTAIW